MDQVLNPELRTREPYYPGPAPVTGTGHRGDAAAGRVIGRRSEDGAPEHEPRLRRLERRAWIVRTTGCALSASGGLEVRSGDPEENFHLSWFMAD